MRFPLQPDLTLDVGPTAIYHAVTEDVFSAGLLFASGRTRRARGQYSMRFQIKTLAAIIMGGTEDVMP